MLEALQQSHAINTETCALLKTLRMVLVTHRCDSPKLREVQKCLSSYNSINNPPSPYLYRLIQQCNWKWSNVYLILLYPMKYPAYFLFKSQTVS